MFEKIVVQFMVMLYNVYQMPVCKRWWPNHRFIFGFPLHPLYKFNPLTSEAPKSARDFLDPIREVAFASPLP